MIGAFVITHASTTIVPRPAGKRGRPPGFKTTNAELAPSDVADHAITHYNFITRSFSSVDQLDRRISVQFEEVATEFHDGSIFSNKHCPLILFLSTSSSGIGPPFQVKSRRSRRQEFETGDTPIRRFLTGNGALLQFSLLHV